MSLDALEVQIDGQHYKSQPIQPVELAYYVNGTPCFCKLAKYLTRDKGDKLVNLQKALHCIALEEALCDFVNKKLPTKRHEYWIKKFNPDTNIKDALMFMRKFEYSLAKHVVIKYAVSLGFEEQGLT